MPSLALGLEEASSDLPSTAGDEAFAVLYPAPHQHGARMEHWGYLGTTFAF